MSPRFFPRAKQVLEILRVHARIPLLTGCSSQSLIVGEHEVEQNAGLTLGLYALPGAELKGVHFTQEQVEEANGPGYWHLENEVEPGQTNGWLVFIDPFHLDSEAWLKTWNEAYAPLPVFGGLASGDFSEQATQVYLNGEVFDEGGVAISVRWRGAVGGRDFAGVHAHRGDLDADEGGAEHHPPDRQPAGLRGAGGDVQLAFARATEDGAGQPVHRAGGERVPGGIPPRRLRDPQRAGGRSALGDHRWWGRCRAWARRSSFSDGRRRRPPRICRSCSCGPRSNWASTTIYGGCLCSCNGRGRGLFGRPDHDAQMVQQRLGPMGLAGFFCNGEIGPVGEKSFLHGFTASLALFVKKSRE